MIKRFGLIWALVLTITCSASGCQTPFYQGNYSPPPRPNTAAGSVVGGASGSLIGAAIGSNEGKPGKGALIGGLIGAAAGGILGNQADRANDARHDYYLQQQQQALNSAVTFDQVVQMSRNGLGSDVIINQINSNGVYSKPNANDLILLKQNGVADEVISALQCARPANEPAVRRVVVDPYAPAPVFERPILVHPAPAYVPPHPAYHWQHYPPRVGHRHHHGHSAGFRIDF